MALAHNGNMTTHLNAQTTTTTTKCINCIAIILCCRRSSFSFSPGISLSLSLSPSLFLLLLPISALPLSNFNRPKSQFALFNHMVLLYNHTRKIREKNGEYLATKGANYVLRSFTIARKNRLLRLASFQRRSMFMRSFEPFVLAVVFSLLFN